MNHESLWVGRDGATPYERGKGRPYRGELCELCEVVHWLGPASKEHKFDSRTSMGIWLGKSSRDDSHLIFDDKVVQFRTVKRTPEERRWQADKSCDWMLSCGSCDPNE